MEEKKIRAQDKWDQKAGLIAKTYKLKKKTVEEFKEACDKMGVSVGPQLEKIMEDYIRKVKK